MSHKVARTRLNSRLLAARSVKPRKPSLFALKMSSPKFSRRRIRRPGPILSALSLVLTGFLAFPPQFAALAGDILRGGSPSAVSHGAAVQGQTAASVQAGAPSGADTLARTTQALSAVKNMQAAARAAAQGGANNLGADPNHPGQQLPNVPNGLGVGGLQVAPDVGSNPSLWVGASLPTQTTSGSKTNVTIVQNQQQALLNWQTFNIGKSTSLTFDQTAGGANVNEWIAFNFVHDPSGVPSQILGSLDALGQIYIINANGIIFGGSSQINLHTLVASALPINDNLIGRGLLNNPDDQFLFSALAIPANTNGGGTPAFTPPSSNPNTPDGHYGDVVVQAGAQITSPTSADHVGGRVALIGANVENDGTITTPDGQTILAAGLQVGFGAHSTSDPTLRGVDVYVGQVGSYAGTATNDGLIEAPRADVTIAGKNVNQLGIIDSSTSVSLNGRIDLLADYNAIADTNTGIPNPSPFLFTSTGLITLGPNSVTQIVPEYSSTERVVGTQLALNSTVFMQGLAIHDESDSILFAPSALVTLDAGVWQTVGTRTSITDSFIFSDGQIYLDSGALIDVSGSQNVAASVSENIVAAQLLGPELANSPLQRDGPLRGQTIYVDIARTGTLNGQTWVGTPLADVTGYVNLVQRTVGELTTNGGTVSLNSGNSIVMQLGSQVNVSGGWINYAGANVTTTQVIDTSGHVFDISAATPDRVYAGILNGFTDVHSKWGLVNTFQSPLRAGAHFEAGYLQGGNGGSLFITSPSMALDGTLAGNTTNGPRQLNTPPVSASLSMAFQGQSLTPIGGVFLPISPTPPDITFALTSNLTPAQPFALDNSGHPLSLSSERQQNVILSPTLLGSDAFGNLTITNGDGNITVPANVLLSAPAKGSITFSAANIDIAGDVTAPGGLLSFNVYDFSPYQFLTLSAGGGAPPPNQSRGQFTLESTGSLSTAGLIIDDRPTAANAQSLPLVTAGGSVILTSYNTDLLPGSSIDVSGGLLVSGTGTQSFGNGGNISIVSGQDPNVKAIDSGHLLLGATLSGFSGAIGGSLTLQDQLIQVGGEPTNPNALLLSPDFFNRGGFTRFSLIGLGAATGQANQFLPGIFIAPGTSITPTAESWVATFDSAGAFTLEPALLPLGSRTPVSLSFNALGVKDNLQGGLVIVRGDLVMGDGSMIQTDPGADVSVTLKGNTVAIDGSVIAPGGNITVAGANDSPALYNDFLQALVTVDLQPDSYLSAAGTTILTPNSLGLRTGTVLNGGTINVSGNIAAEAGSTLDVSGASDVLDLDPGYSNQAAGASVTGLQTIPTRVDTNGGTITFLGGQELFVDSTLLGSGGGPGAIGGTLSLSSGRFYQIGAQPTPLDPTLAVTQSGPTISYPFYASGDTGIGRVVSSVGGLTGMGVFAADSFTGSGFASLNLFGTVEFLGPVNLSASRSISVASAGVLYADSNVQLDAPYVRIGTSFLPPFAANQPTNAFFVQGSPFYFSPKYGVGSLSISSSLIDIGNISLQGIGTANLVAANGDVRGDGTFDIAGNLSITAGQIYPTTESKFTIAAYDYFSGGLLHPGSINLAASGTRSLPLSAGGQLSLYSSIIDDAGILRAPLGTINIGWNGSGTAPIDQITGANVPIAQQATLEPGSVISVSAIDPVTGNAATIPYGVNPVGTSWIDPAGTDITSGGVPQKTITISAANVSDLGGSTIDLRGGGDLYAYQFMPGTGGTIDVLNTSSSFAVIPGYGLGYAPYATFSPVVGGSDIGYTNSTLSVGDSIYLNASNGLAAGFYTLLPARYALLPGAFLVTPESGTPTTGVALPDGSAVVSGYRFNGFGTPASAPLFSSFQVAPESVVRQRASYSDYSGNSFLKQGALASGQAVPRLPIDAGQLVLAASSTIAIQGSVNSSSPTGGLGSLVDISAPGSILIGNAGAMAPGSLVLDASSLTAFGADSLLIGGYRQTTASGTVVNVTADTLTVDNSNSPLQGPDVILASNQSLILEPNAIVESTGAISNAGTLLLTGNGALLRVSSDPSAQILRTGVDPSQPVAMMIGAGATVTGASLILDSTSLTTLASSASISGKFVYLNSGQISLQLANTGNPSGLVLSSQALAKLQAGAQSLSLLSYSTIDIYGAGSIGAVDSAGTPILANLALHAGEIRGFGLNGGNVDFNAQTILIDNSSNVTGLGVVSPIDGSLTFKANTIQLGANQTAIDQFENVMLDATKGVLFQNTGSLATAGSFTVNTPVITGSTSASEKISAAGCLDIEPLSGSQASLAGGLGAQLTLSGATITENGSISLRSGIVTLNAIGNISIGGSVDVTGTTQTFFDTTRYTGGGQIALNTINGFVSLTSTGSLSVAAQSGGGNAGTISVSAPNGTFVSDGTLSGHGGAGGENGNFVLDVEALPDLAPLSAILSAGAFSQSQSIRVRSGDVVVDGTTNSRVFDLSVDHGSVNVTGTIDASGVTGGTIDLVASGSVILQSGSLLTVAAEKFNNAGKGGAISLDAGSETDGVIDPTALLDIRTGSTIDLSVANNTPNSAALGDFSGTLHLRAPQTSNSTDLQMNPIDGTIVGASAITVEGYKIFDTTGNGSIDNQEASVFSNGQAFTANSAAITSRILANNAGLAPITVVVPGAEIINKTGDLTLGFQFSDASSDWDLSTYRFGSNNVPGVLTLRAAGNIIFYNALSDGFDPSQSLADDPSLAMWLAPLMARNSALPTNVQSWSYNITAGADFSGARSAAVQSLNSVGVDAGSVMLGQDAGNGAVAPGFGSLTADAIFGHYQVIRTGAGNISVNAARDVQFLNPFAAIYTAGVAVDDPTLGGTFALPNINSSFLGVSVGALGAVQQLYPAQYSYAGGNVSIFAQDDIIHLTRDNQGQQVADSSRELPNNWLYRRGYVDPATGMFGRSKYGEIASTTWWVDFSNFFEDVGALGGGNVTLTAGRDVSNVDAVVPTNARMPNGLPTSSHLVELGGGDVTVLAGNDINGGAYYVERGDGVLTAGDSILTNSTRSPSLGNISIPSTIFPSATWLPTTLFLGKGNFDVSANGDVLLGPVANPFLLPQSLNNTFWYKTYFSTYASTDSVSVASLAGNITLRESAVLPGNFFPSSESILQMWLEQEDLLRTGFNTVPLYQPWLRLAETSMSPFQYVFSLAPPTLRATSFSGDVNLVGNLTLSPSPIGNLSLVATNSVNALQPDGTATPNDKLTTFWTNSIVDVSDSDPNAIPQSYSPLANQVLVGTSNLAVNTNPNILDPLNRLFKVSGSTTGAQAVLQAKQALHAPGILHSADTQPIQVYAVNGDISGLTLFSPTVTRIVSGRDITDIGLYLQNVSADDISVVSAGRDIIAYDPNSLLRSFAQSLGNAFSSGVLPSTGDIQLAGPGTLEVLAGRNLSLGVGPINSDGTGSGISTIGNTSNPYLPFDGANVIASAGVGGAADLGSLSNVDFDSFIAQFLNPNSSGAQSERYLPDLGDALGLKNATNDQIWAVFQQLSEADQAKYALGIFYLVLRDAGRDRDDPSSPNFGSYTNGFAAIMALFPNSNYSGDISLTSRAIKTTNGGDINLLAPGGALNVGLNVTGSQAADQGILTQHGGNINIFTHNSVNVGTSRIFTLRGGNEIIWSSAGDIAAGSSSKTVLAAPPTRVLIDPQSADVQTDLAGLATGGGIGVLESVSGIPPADVDLIAPVGAINAGDAGIRVSGNLNLAALIVVNAANITVGGSSVGVPTVAAPNIGSLTSASNTAAASSNAAQQLAGQNAGPAPQDETPSIISVEVLGYGGGEDEEERRRKKKQQQENQGSLRDRTETVTLNPKKGAQHNQVIRLRNLYTTTNNQTSL